MDPFEKEKHDHYKVVLLETLGNARLDHSYDYIVSHINSTNSPWIKRAGCHALRKYEHDHVIFKKKNSSLFLWIFLKKILSLEGIVLFTSTGI